MKGIKPKFELNDVGGNMEILGESCPKPEGLFDPSDNPFQTIEKLSDGLPKVINILMALQLHDIGEWILILLALAEMEIKGAAIIKLYDEDCGKDMDKFIGAVHRMKDEKDGAKEQTEETQSESSPLEK